MIDKSIIYLHKMAKNKEFKDIFYKSFHSDKILKKTRIFIKDNFKYYDKIFFEELKFDFENRYKLGDSFLEIFKNPFLLDFVKEDKDYYIFKIEEGYIYNNMSNYYSCNFLYHVQLKLNEYFQKQFNTKIFLFVESANINDIVINNGYFKFFDLKRLNLLDKNNLFYYL